ncbi:hypothetical protein MSAN_02522500 [Mycena sanguinolenta]|uniref:DUF6589 domain-containing protein n=1 Tax=Mycena sanguinolenta TaxID=230812 RepID=A0A8H6TV78_9AGAR|nr:hypothetical protein MSAN_02522500 [Mycena sanguinolenta]
MYSGNYLPTSFASDSAHNPPVALPNGAVTDGRHLPLAEKRSHKRKAQAVPPPLPQPNTPSNSFIPSNYDVFWSKSSSRSTLSRSQSQNSVFSRPIDELISETREKFKYSDFPVPSNSSQASSPLRRTQSQSNFDSSNQLPPPFASRRSQQCSDFAGPLTLFWWKNGCSRETIEVLQNLGLAKSFDSALAMVESVANYCIEDARMAARDPGGFMANWDNINISTSDFVEQRSGGPAKVRSGTYAIVYRLRNPNPRAMALAPLLARAETAPDLDFNLDVCPTLIQSISSYSNFRAYVVRVLCRYTKEFKEYAEHPALQHTPRRPLPDGYKTIQFPVRISSIEENSIAGNLAVHEDVFVAQLQLSHAELSKNAILSINDQATQALNRGCKGIRAFDLNPFTRAQVFQLGIGLFHLCLNLVWAVLHSHRGHEATEGSLSYFFVILEKTRLGGKHPDYHSLLAALMQILDGLLLDAWRLECGATNLSAFAATRPTPEEILVIADRILSDRVKPERLTSPVDVINGNTRKLIHDLLHVAEVTRAVAAGDFGRVEDLLGNLAMIFRGAGSKNYCTEILYFMHNLKYVWKGDGFDELVRDNMVFKMNAGRDSKGQGVDMNIEQNIGKIKELFAAKGVYGSWDRLANISAAIDVLGSVKTNMAASMGASYNGIGHKDVDTSDLVWRVASKARELKLNVAQKNREGKPTPDLLVVGETVLKSSTLSTFNKKRRELLKGIISVTEEDTDDIPTLDILVTDEQEQ